MCDLFSFFQTINRDPGAQLLHRQEVFRRQEVPRGSGLPLPPARVRLGGAVTARLHPCGPSTKGHESAKAKGHPR